MTNQMDNSLTEIDKKASKPQFPGNFVSSRFIRCPACSETWSCKANVALKAGVWKESCPHCQHQFKFYTGIIVSPPLINPAASNGDGELDSSNCRTVHDSDADAALEQCERILSGCDEIPERGSDFAEGVRERTESIQSWIEDNGEVTPAQQTALDNMEYGVSRWIDR